MCIERGSTWNRWDFHVHTPYSVLNNEFGFNIEEDHRGEHFDNFVKTLFQKAVQCGIVAIGVTDYFSIDGYKRIRKDCSKFSMSRRSVCGFKRKNLMKKMHTK